MPPDPGGHVPHAVAVDVTDRGRGQAQQAVRVGSPHLAQLLPVLAREEPDHSPPRLPVELGRGDEEVRHLVIVDVVEGTYGVPEPAPFGGGNPMEHPARLARVDEDHAIVSGEGDTYYKVPYTRSGDDITFAPFGEWIEGERPFVPKAAEEKEDEAALMLEIQKHLVEIGQFEINEFAS